MSALQSEYVGVVCTCLIGRSKRMPLDGLDDIVTIALGSGINRFFRLKFAMTWGLGM